MNIFHSKISSKCTKFQRISSNQQNIPNINFIYQFLTDNLDEVEKNKTDFDINEEQLPVFHGIDLPDNFLQIIKDPFNIKLESKFSEELLICLEKGDIVTMKLLNRNIPIPKELSCQPILIADGEKTN